MIPLRADRSVTAEMVKMQEDIRVATLKLSKGDLLKLHRALNEIVYAANIERYTKKEGK